MRPTCIVLDVLAGQKASLPRHRFSSLSRNVAFLFVFLCPQVLVVLGFRVGVDVVHDSYVAVGVEGAIVRRPGFEMLIKFGFGCWL